MSARTRLVALATALTVSLALLAVPAGSTHAAWRSGAQVHLGAVVNDSLDLVAVSGGESSTWPDPITVQLRNESSRLSGGLTVSHQVTPAGWDGGLSQVADVRSTDCLTGHDLDGRTLAPGEDGQACLSLEPSLLQHAGASVDVTSVFGQGNGSWSDVETVNSRYRVPFPRPVAPATGPACTGGGLVGRATLHWAWPDATTDTTGVASPAVQSWSLQRLSQNQWVTLRSGIPAASRSTQISSDLLLGLLATHRLRIVAHPAAGGEVVPASFDVRVTTVLDLLGINVLVICGSEASVP
jgi:hypothetical protein